jgi:hypothetical protein
MAASDVFTKVLPAAHADVAIQLFEERETNKIALMVDEIENITTAWTKAVPQNKAEAAALSELMSRASIALKELEALRVERTKPLVAEQRSVNGIFKIITDPVEVFVDRAKKAYVAWQQADRARIQREEEENRRRLEEAARKEREALERAAAAKSEAARKKALAEAEAASQAQAQAVIEAPLAPVKGIRTDSGTASTIERWTFKVLKPELIPRQYLEVNEQAIRAAVRSGVREIPGVAIFLEESAQIRVGVGTNPYGGRR